MAEAARAATSATAYGDDVAEPHSAAGRARRIRILRVIARLNVGGPALHTTLLTERLDPSRYESLLVAGDEAAHEGSWLTLRGAPIAGLVKIPGLGREIAPRQDAAALVELVRTIRRFRPDVVHTHTAKAGTLGRLAALLCRVPAIVHTFHGHVLAGYFSPARTRAFLAIERALARRTTRILAVSENVRRELLALGIGDAQRCQVLPLGLDLEPLARAARLRGGLRAELRLPDDTPLVGIVARLVPIKAHEVFIDAAVRIAASLPEARFLVIGDGERRAELEARVAEAGLSPRLRFLGWRGDLDRVYADLDVVVLTSRNEGSPVALIEAMAAGRAVVSTRVGGVADVVEHGRTGLLTEVDDGAAIAEATLGLLADPGRRTRLGLAARATVLDRFAADRLLADVDAVYRDILRVSRTHA